MSRRQYDSIFPNVSDILAVRGRLKEGPTQKTCHWNWMILIHFVYSKYNLCPIVADIKTGRLRNTFWLFRESTSTWVPETTSDLPFCLWGNVNLRAGQARCAPHPFLMGINALNFKCFHFWDNQLMSFMTGGSWMNIAFAVLILDSLGLAMISALSIARLVGGSS